MNLSFIFSTQESRAYQKRIVAYTHYNYKKALLHFEFDSDFFKLNQVLLL